MSPLFAHLLVSLWLDYCFAFELGLAVGDLTDDLARPSGQIRLSNITGKLRGCVLLMVITHLNWCAQID